ncbi:hypothetical protein KG088_17640 [Halomonas sp. TRM85114]|uniref:neuraminidase-like domain-containing protein n=1 Tax=Halomonas jincaotanensis TaxID=2810616 RepID=UPI001BD2D829|nr:neuraminidase-like domain-containing protein [Halomonas jincaotanensis]MBS9405433.1 hypothetical protein [Halomonas jincaotanensis]
MNTITFPLTLDMQGLAVADLHDALQLCLERGALLADDKDFQREIADELKREQDEQTYGDVTSKLVSYFQTERQLQVSGDVDEPTAGALNRLLKELGALRPTGEYQVTGRVVSRVSAALNGLRVVVVDKAVGSDGTLAEAQTDARGYYAVSFSEAELRRRGKEKPDLQSRVFSGNQFLAASEVRYDASTQETLNILLDEKASSNLRSEHETLASALSMHYKGKLSDLQETDERQDITYLANKSGWDARAVALTALADQFSAKTAFAGANVRIEPPFFYALFRSGVPANEAAVYRTDSKTVEGIWNQALKQNVIPSNLHDRLPEAMKLFQRVASQQLLEGPALAGLSSFKDLLAISLSDTRQQQQVADLYVHHGHDPEAFWQQVQGTLGDATMKQLKLDGQLAYLTMSNAPLIEKLHAAAGENGLQDSAQLVAQGFHRAAKWLESIGSDRIPSEVPGRDESEKRERYAELLAAQLRFSFPTATVAQMVKSGETPVVAADARSPIHGFLTQHEDKFEIGMQPVAQYVARNNLQVAPEVAREVTRIQRVYQITPDDESMNGLLKKGIDSAYAVVRYERDEFLRAFKDDVGGEQNARLVHAKAQQVHTAVLNVALTFLTARSAPGIGVHSPASIVDPTPSPPAHAADVLAYATLENLFGEMDYCTCEHCRSILSPAAYLVDLLRFLYSDDGLWASFVQTWKSEHANAPYPFYDQASWTKFQDDWNSAHPGEQLPNTEISPFDVLISRRPDIQHLPLTCENTNTPLPYIDLVNETLEYYVTNGLTLAGYRGHDTDDSVKPEELLASPQFVGETAYTALAKEHFPPPLPFHQSLDSVRRYFGRFEAPLAEIMEALRKDDSLERASDAEYGWRDIWMETLGLSRAEHRLLAERWLTGSATDVMLTVKRLYGFDPATADADGRAVLDNAKSFSHRVGITYEQLVEILRTRFVNPNSHLIPRLERLGVPFATLKALKDGSITDAEFDALLAPGLNPAQYGGNIKEWVKNDDNYSQIMGLLTLTNPADPENVCRFDKVELRYSNPDTSANQLRSFEFIRLIRFIRLWKKLGWTIEQTDKAISALYPAGQTPDDPSDAVNLERLDAGFLILLPSLGVLRRVMDLLKLAPQKDLFPLLASFAPIGTHGESSLYRQMFLSASLLDEAFAEDGYGNYLTNTAKKLLDHGETLRAAFSLTASEFSHITAALDYDAGTVLTLNNVSAVFRRGWLARKLKLSVQELLLLTQLTGYNPFETPDPTAPAILRLIEFVGRLRAIGVKPVQALYLVWNQDLSGKSAPDEAEVTEFARTLRGALTAIEGEFTVVDDPDGSIARARMALVYGNDATDLFFGLLENTFVTAVEYDHNQDTLDQPIMDASPGHIAYDDFRKRLSYTGVLTTATRDALKAVPGVTETFKDAVDALYAENQKVVRPFFYRYPELLPLYDVYVVSADPVEAKRTALLEAFLPELKRRRKRQQALQSVSAASEADIRLASALLEIAAVLHAAGDVSRPALDDVAALETTGLAARYFYAPSASGSPDLNHDAEANLEYVASGNNKLPPNATTPGGPISGIWSGHLEAPENGFYNIRIDTDATAAVALTLNGAAVALAQSDSTWSNTAPIELRAGTLYAVSLTVENLKDNLALRWQTAGRGWEIIPAPYLYSATLIDNLRQAYIRFLKATALAGALKLTAAELAHLAAHADYQVDGEGWMNHMPTTDSPDSATAALFKAFGACLDLSSLKADLSPGDERLLEVLQNPAAATDAEGLLYVLTHWEKPSLDAFLVRFGKAAADLAHVETLRRVYDAYGWVKKLGVPAAVLIEATTNEPTAATMRSLQSALRARYDESAWLEVLRPINDAMRSLQRDALVAYILHRMRSDPASAHIDTPEKLFEYFLMDVQMDPCMLTSRIRHALSSLQLFIERCLMNLEPRVSPASIKTKQWEWMKRYRVWEANRKVFLWPENWLEPELRDDQSPFFKETMSELLQGDITEDRAAEALVGYLTKLEEVAKLEICGIHYEENGEGTANDIAHVIARTAGANRKYFYRRREGGFWTPWEKVGLDVEDNPVLPVVWKNRLFLFWLKLVQETQQETPPSPTGDSLADVDPSQVFPNETPKVVVKVILNWSEFLNGKWQPTRTSDPARPLEPRASGYDPSGPYAFDRTLLTLSALLETKGLRIIVSGHGFVGWGPSFFLYNSYSTPERESVWVHFIPMRSLVTSTATLKIFDQDTGDSQSVLSNDIARHSSVEPHHQIDGNTWTPPFFYEDSRHVFYVTTEEHLVPVSQWSNFPIFLNPPKPAIEIAELVLKQEKGLAESIPHTRQPGFGVVDPSPLERYVTEDANIATAIGTPGTVDYGDANIGPSGSRF